MTPTGRRRLDHGDTLVEVLLAVVIMGTLVVAIMTGFLTAAQNQHRHADFARAETLTRSFIEDLQSHATNYSSCGANFGSASSGDLTAAVANVGYWVPGSSSPAQYAGSCGGGGGTADLQKVTVNVTRGSDLIMSTDAVLRTTP